MHELRLNQGSGKLKTDVDASLLFRPQLPQSPEPAFIFIVLLLLLPRTLCDTACPVSSHSCEQKSHSSSKESTTVSHRVSVTVTVIHPLTAYTTVILVTSL